MKTLPVATVLGVLIALPIIYALQPLNAAAVGLLSVLCIGSAQLALAFRSSRKAGRMKSRSTDPPHIPSKKPLLISLLLALISGLLGALLGGTYFLLHLQHRYFPSASSPWWKANCRKLSSPCAYAGVVTWL
jgi:hypothetical protein